MLLINPLRPKGGPIASNILGKILVTCISRTCILHDCLLSRVPFNQHFVKYFNVVVVVFFLAPVGSRTEID